MHKTTVRSVGGLLALLCIAACEDDNGVANGDDDGVALEQIVSGLTSPVALVAAPGTDRRFIVDQAGTIRVLSADGTLETTPFLDVRSRMVTLNAGYDERGLLGLAFHPDYATNDRFFVYYSAPLSPGGPAGWDHTARISEFTVSDDPDVADAASERVLLEVDQPQGNHNGGTLAFGNDGYLYVSLGDGGNADDVGMGHVDDWYEENEGGNAQNLTTLLGKILRLDVGTPGQYGIPADNPFVGEDGLDEIFAYGFRNPYRFSVNRATGDLLVGDAGQNRYEEVSLVVKGGNYGWNVYEGAHCFDTDDPDDVDVTGCPTTDAFGVTMTPPVIEYEQADLDGLGVVVVGGYMYRGDEVDALAGRYVFGDFSRSFDSADGSVFVATPAGTGPWSFEEVTFEGSRLGAYLLGFGEDADGELYVLVTDNVGPTGATGRVYKLVEEDD